MFAHQQPAAVGKEEAALGIVGISLCFWVLVVHSMVTRPLDDVILYKRKASQELISSLLSQAA